MADGNTQEDFVRKRRSLREYAGLVLRGFCMGAADIVPGVSGGTMAFILGMYEELIDSIRTFGRRKFFSALVRFRVREILAMTNWAFLLAVGSGIILAILLLSRGLEYMLDEQPLILWSFFFGLVLASFHVVSLHIRRWTLERVILFLIGALGAFLFVGLVAVETPDDAWFLMLSGAVAICAMILPGISGSFLLVLLGKYEFVLNAVNTRDILSIGYIAIGAVFGIILFSQFLSWLLHRYHDATVALLAGLMLGSLRRVWPWKIPDGFLQERNMIPPLRIDGAINPELLIGVIGIAAGFVLVFVLEKVAMRTNA